MFRSDVLHTYDSRDERRPQNFDVTLLIQYFSDDELCVIDVRSRNIQDF